MSKKGYLGLLILILGIGLLTLVFGAYDEFASVDGMPEEPGELTINGAMPLYGTVTISSTATFTVTDVTGRVEVLRGPLVIEASK